VVQLVTEADRTTLAVAWPVTKRGEPCQTLRASFTPGVPPDPWHLHLLLTGVCGIAATLSELHARGVTHRNLTTDGIIVTGDGRFALRDLGLAGHSSRPGEGPADYQAPEQRPGGGTQRLGPATDVYQLASITYHLVTGRLPALRQPAPARSLNQELPEAVSDLLAAALGASPAGRPRMSEFRPTER
jgi:serine/threonine protein kinase